MNSEVLADLSNDLKKRITGELYTDSANRALYSTDASIYQIEPLGVMIPKTQDDLIATIEAAAKYSVPILARGSGSSLAGQAVGAALVIDFTRHLNRIISIDSEARTAVVEPGVVLDVFNRAASPFGIKFGPDPASSDRATFGGMIGNNSTGAHSIQFGMTADNLIALDVLLSDSVPASLGEVSLTVAAQRAELDSVEGKLYRTALQIREKFSDEIKLRWPKTWRRSSGYSLNYLLPWSAAKPPQWEEQVYPPQRPDHINLAPLLAGSEGTLAMFRRAQIKLVATPKETIIGVLSFESVADACDAAPDILSRNPSAIELIPRALIQLARGVPAYADLLWFVKGDPEALLVVEFSGDDRKLLEGQVRALGPQTIIADTKILQDQIWKVRKVGLGLLMSRPGDVKPLPFVEDVAVPVERLGEFVREFQNIMSTHNTTGDFYAHASAGCLHVRPLINMKTASGQQVMRAITEAVVALTVRLGGALSGEHGDGLARSEWLEKVYGAQLLSAFADLKHAADPDGILNPGKIIDPPPMNKNLRYTPDYQTSAWKPIMDFSSQGGLAGAVEMCNGSGVCRKEDGVMCPSFQASHDEMHSTRGRANLLRAMISGNFPGDRNAEEAVFESLDLCLECKGCKAECPSAVDMAKLKYEFLQQYYLSHRRPLRDYLFSYIDTIARLGMLIAPIANTILRARPTRWAAQRLLGISSRRKIPALKATKPATENNNSSGEDVILLMDAFTKYFNPEIARAVYDVLSASGCQVHRLSIVGAGRTYISKGFLKQAQKHAHNVIKEIKQMDPDGKMAIVGVEPSEIYTLRDEYLDFFPGDEAVKLIAGRTFMVEEFLVRPDKDGKPRLAAAMSARETMGKGRVVYVHGHCFQKAQPPSTDGYPIGVQATMEFLRLCGSKPHLIESGCCGMAGSFGYEAEHYDLSMQIGEMQLLPAVRALDEDVLVVAPGVSCRTQIESIEGRFPLHPAQLFQ